MQTRLARSWSALRYDLSAQRALDNAARTTVFVGAIKDADSSLLRTWSAQGHHCVICDL
mgnify:CR=1 FL=1